LIGGASSNPSLAAFLQESELLAGMRMAGRKNVMLLGLCFVLALGVAAGAGFGLGRRRRHRARRLNRNL
jgi:hypothetical protein